MLPGFISRNTGQILLLIVRFPCTLFANFPKQNATLKNRRVKHMWKQMGRAVLLQAFLVHAGALPLTFITLKADVRDGDEAPNLGSLHAPCCVNTRGRIHRGKSNTVLLNVIIRKSSTSREHIFQGNTSQKTHKFKHFIWRDVQHVVYVQSTQNSESR